MYRAEEADSTNYLGTTLLGVERVRDSWQDKKDWGWGTTAIPASRLDPGPVPSTSNIRSENSGKINPKNERMNDAAETALAANVNESTRYSWMPANINLRHPLR